MNFKDFCVQEGLFDTWGMDPYLKAIYQNAAPDIKKLIKDTQRGKGISLEDAIREYIAQSKEVAKMQALWQHVPQGQSQLPPDDFKAATPWKKPEAPDLRKTQDLRRY